MTAFCRSDAGEHRIAALACSSPVRGEILQQQVSEEANANAESRIICGELSTESADNGLAISPVAASSEAGISAIEARQHSSCAKIKAGEQTEELPLAEETTVSRQICSEEKAAGSFGSILGVTMSEALQLKASESLTEPPAEAGQHASQQPEREQHDCVNGDASEHQAKSTETPGCPLYSELPSNPNPREISCVEKPFEGRKKEGPVQEPSTEKGPEKGIFQSEAAGEDVNTRAVQSTGGFIEAKASISTKAGVSQNILKGSSDDKKQRVESGTSSSRDQAGKRRPPGSSRKGYLGQQQTLAEAAVPDSLQPEAGKLHVRLPPAEEHMPRASVGGISRFSKDEKSVETCQTLVPERLVLGKTSILDQEMQKLTTMTQQLSAAMDLDKLQVAPHRAKDSPLADSRPWEGCGRAGTSVLSTS